MHAVPPPPADSVDLDLRSRSVQVALAFLLGVGATLAGVKLWDGRTTRPAEVKPLLSSPYRVDVNRATPHDLMQIPRVGPALADRIIAARPYGSIDDLDQVPGVGPATLSRLKPHIAIGSGYTSSKPPPAAGPVDPNTATIEQLQTLPGIGPKMAQRIIDERSKRPFASVEDLRRVSGIGVKTLEKLRGRVVIKSNA